MNSVPSHSNILLLNVQGSIYCVLKIPGNMPAKIQMAIFVKSLNIITTLGIIFCINDTVFFTTKQKGVFP